MFAPVGRMAGWLRRRLGAPLVVFVRRTMRSPGRFVAFILSGIVAGTAIGFVGPLIGAALGGLAGSVVALFHSPPD
jgi:membrane associated rhomboid family serine protease